MCRTHQAVEDQLRAFGDPGFEVWVRRPDGKMKPRKWGLRTVLRAVSWLRLMNRDGCDVYIRTVGRRGLILLDDVTPAALAAMRRDGFTPTVTIQTSPGNYQAWVRLVANP